MGSTISPAVVEAVMSSELALSAEGYLKGVSDWTTATIPRAAAAETAPIVINRFLLIILV
jgi:hypothetical protein